MILTKKIYKKIKYLKGRIETLEHKTKNYYIEVRPTVECETCGCLLDTMSAFKGMGKLEIGTPITTVDGFPLYQRRKITVAGSAVYVGGEFKKEEYLRDRYYCKIHKKNKKPYGIK